MNLKNTLAPLLFALLIPAASHAEEKEPAQPQNLKGYASALMGDAVVTSGGGSSAFTYSGRAGTSIYQDHSGMLSLGVFASSWSNSETLSGTTVDGRLTSIMGELVTREAFGTGIYFGARAGLALTSATVTASGTSASASGTSFAFAPVAGYEFALSKQLRLAADLSWLNRTGLTMAFPNGSSVKLDSAAAMLFQAGLGYRF